MFNKPFLDCAPIISFTDLHTSSGVAPSTPRSEVSQSSVTYECPFCLGIGNKDTDAKAYYNGGVPLENIFIMKKSGDVTVGEFIPTCSDILSHRSSRCSQHCSTDAKGDSNEDMELIEATVHSISLASSLQTLNFTSYDDPRLQSYAKQLIVSSDKGGSICDHLQSDKLGSADV